MTAFLSGEMKDTVEINPAGAYGQFFPSSCCVVLIMHTHSLGTFFFTYGTC